MGLALGLAGGTVRSLPERPVAARLSDWSLAALAVGAALTTVILPVYFRVFDPDTNELIVGIALQIVLSSAIGAVGGAAFGFGLGGRSRTLSAVLGGLLGGAAGALVYEMAGALAFPLAKTSSPIAMTWGARLLARLTVTILASVGVAMGALDQGKRAIARPISGQQES